MRDLHALVRTEGIQNIADILGITERCLVDLRRGEHPLTVDDFYTLGRKYKDFDIEGTIDRIGSKRKNEGKQSHPRSYKIKNGQKWAEGPQRLMGRLPNCS